MANKPLQSIKFPGLSDTYTTPQVDATLTTTGAAADAKKTGDEISSIKQDLNDIESSIFDTNTFQPIPITDYGTNFTNKAVDTSLSTETGLRIKNNTGRALCRFIQAEKDGKVFVKSVDTTHSVTVIISKLANPSFTPQSGEYSEQIESGFTTFTTILGEEITVPKGYSLIVDYNKAYSFNVTGNIYVTRNLLNENLIQQVENGLTRDTEPTKDSSNIVDSGAIYKSLKNYVAATVIGTGKNKFDKNDSGNQVHVLLDGTTGRTSTNAAYDTSYYIPITAGKHYVAYNTYAQKISGRSYAFYDDQKEYISGANSYTSIDTAPEGAAYLRICISTGNFDYIMLIEGYYYQNETYEDYEEIRAIAGTPIVPEESVPFFIKKSLSHNQYDPNNILLNSSINAYGYREYNTTYYTSNVVYCGGYDVLISAFEIQDSMSPSASAMNPRNIAFYDRNMNFIGMADASQYTYIWDVYGFAYTRCVIPSRAFFVIVGYSSSNTTIRRMIYCANGAYAFPLYKYEDYEEAFVVRNDIVKEKTYIESPFNGKTLNVIGDSITYGYGTYTTLQKAFPYLTGYKLNMAVNNYGINSSEIAEKSAGDTTHNPMCIRYVDMVDADVIVVAGGTNDWEHADVTLGQMGDTVTTTFYGALDTLCKGLIRKYPDKIIIFMTPIKRSTYYSPNALGYIQAQFADAIKEVCAFYAIPVLDMFEKCTIVPTIEENRSQWLVDNTHPNQAGQNYLASMLTGFIASLCN